MALLTRFGSPIDPAKFLTAVDTVVSQSDCLRTLVRDVDGVPHPTISAAPPAPCAVTRVDPNDLDAWVAERIAQPLDVAKSSYESVLIDLGNDDWAWFMNVHHLVIDASSSANLFNAVASEYEGRSVALDSYEQVWSDLIAGVNPKRLTSARDYWEIQPEPQATQLYTAGEATSAAERVYIDMSAGRQDKFDAFVDDPRFKLLSPELSRAAGLALMTASYLARLGNDTVTIGVPIHHRSTKASKAVIGPLVELFPLRIEVADDDSFATLHKKIARSFFTLLSNALPGTSPRQSFDIVLNVQGARMGSFGTIDATTSWIHPGHVDKHHLLRIQALDYDDTGVIELGVDINHAAGNSGHRQRARHHIAAVFDAMLDDPNRLVQSISLLDDDERLLLEPFTHPGGGTPIDGAVPSVVSQRLMMHGDRPAIRTADGETLTAREVDEEIEAISTHLRRAGYGPGDLIGVEMGISHEAVCIIHGIQRAGAAFVPIDPTYPEARREHIRTDSHAKLVVSARSDIDSLPVVDAEPAAFVQRPSDLAYVIYTSGSTGMPKGVPITHEGLGEYLGFAYSTYIDRESPTMPLFTSLSFDLTITTLYLPLLSGGLMTIHPEGGLAALGEIVDQGLATLVKATPSHLELLVRMLGERNKLEGLSGLIVGGEAFMVDLADRLLEQCGPSLRIYNEYGPTEAVVGCMVHLYDPEHDNGPEVPIGRPAPGVGLHILDRFGYPVPLGVPGELHISRPGMTAGYLGRDDLSVERLAVIPESGSADVLYKTGDLTRMADANKMVYLGRVDEQIKVGGIRLEPGEIEFVAQSVPGVARAVTRLWTPTAKPTVEHCVRCGLPSDVPDVVIDGDGVCSSCHQFELVAPQAEAWFRNEDDLAEVLADARARSTGDYDVIHLISGGKDSTYAMYKLVEMGARVFAITLDNGFIAEVAKANVRRATEALGVDHEFVTVEGMNDIFRDSLERFSNVCNGCYKAIYTIALAKAEELGIGAIVTGLSRGQFFETRLVPEMFGEDRFDPDAIDEMVRQARHVYHTTPDAVSENMDVEFLADPEIFDRITFIDIYRYVDVPLSEMYAALEASNTWQRPPDSGRSTNCLINSAGIFVHKMEQQHHNYAAPYSWDVRLGHKTREEALFELDDPMDDEELAAITSMLAEVGYEPKKPEVLTLWVEASADFDAALVEAALANELPSHAIPRAIEVVPEIPLTANGKVDSAALPAPSIWRTVATRAGRSVSGTVEKDIASVWSSVLGLPEVGAVDDFFALGGTSLHALEMIVRISDHFGIIIPESLAFKERTVSDLARYVEERLAELDHGATNTSSAPDFAIPTLGSDVAAPLSAGEAAMLYEWRRDPTDPRYNVARLYELPDTFDRDRLDAALRAVVAHQPTLHTSYGIDRAQLDVDDALRIGDSESTVAPLTALAEQLNDVPFDLVHGPLITAHFLSGASPEGPVRRGLLLRTHHIVSDAGSLDIFWEQLDLAYGGEPLPPLAITYAEHGAWQASRPTRPEELWAPGAPLSNLRVRTEAPEADGYLHREASVTTSQLRQAPAPTLFGNALAALAAGLRSFHEGPNIELNVTSSVRDHPLIKDVVGYFLNPLPLLLPVERHTSLRELALRTGNELSTALEHRAVPFGEVISSARERGVEPPSGRVMLAVEDLAPSKLDGEVVDHTILASGTAVNDLTFFVQLRAERVELGVEYRGSVVSRAQAKLLLDAFSAALDMVATQPDSTVADLYSAPAPLAGVPLVGSEQPVAGLIAASIENGQDAKAVSSGGTSISYRDLDERARVIAARLRAIGVGSNDRVALCLERSVDLIPAIYATWMIGASYVPIDISQPASRLTALISAAGVQAAVSSGAGHPGLSEVPTVLVDVPDPRILPLVQTDFAGPDDEAYVIFTSGSTGRPKGVSISHRNLEASVRARRQWYDRPVARYLLVSSAAFDSSIAGLFWTLADGGELIIPSEREVHDIDALTELISDHDITHGLMVPSVYAAMLQRDPGALTGLDVVIVAGEACPPSIIDTHFTALPGTQLINEYGPTEATVWATVHRCTPRDGERFSVPIGTPIPGMTVEVIDTTGTPAPIDVAGELRLSGPGISNGYISTGDDDESECFGSIDGGRTYLTGDLVVRRGSGSIDFLGRIDDQLSVGGVRLEPSEVEVAFTNLDGVEACLVAATDRGLIAYIEPMRGAEERLDTAELRRRAAMVLPASHLPRQIRIVRELPRNTNGKLDRNALDTAALDSPITSVASMAPAHASKALVDSADDDQVVQKIVEIFSAAFDGEQVTSTSDFFELGGDSLRAVAVVSMLEAEFGKRVAIGELIDAPTPQLLANQRFGVGTSRPADSPLPAVPSRPDTDELVEWLRATGTQRPLVVLPPGGGNLLRYAPLVRSLSSDIPVVGLRLPGADARSEIVDSIEGQAAVMLDALDTAVPNGPYRLLGWSTGGLLAWEIARLLTARGDQVEAVVLVDTVMAGLRVDDTGTIREKYQDMLRNDGAKAVASESARRAYERVDFALARRRYRNARASGQTPSFTDAERQLGPVIRRAAAKYRPDEQSIRVIYVSASESSNAVTVDPWRELHGDVNFEVVTIEGVHFLPEDQCIIGFERAPELVERLTEIMDL